MTFFADLSPCAYFPPRGTESRLKAVGWLEDGHPCNQGSVSTKDADVAMPLEPTDRIDLITKALPGDACALVLYVIDSGEVKDELRRYELLIQKLTGYVRHVTSPQFKAENPGLEPKDVLIKVLWTTPPNSTMEQVTAIGPKGDEAGGVPVSFVSYREFQAKLKQDRGAP